MKPRLCIVVRLVILLMLIMAGVACGDIETEEVMAPRQPSGAGEADLSGEASFGETVLPLLGKYCSLCHNPSSAAGGLDLTSYASVTADAEVVVPGDPDTSLLIGMLEGGVMPPPGNPKPSPEEIAAIRAWIAAGALDN